MATGAFRSVMPQNQRGGSLDVQIACPSPAGYVQISPWLTIGNKERELMARYMGEMGLTPSFRSRLSVQIPIGPKPWEFGAGMTTSHLRQRCCACASTEPPSGRKSPGYPPIRVKSGGHRRCTFNLRNLLARAAFFSMEHRDIFPFLGHCPARHVQPVRFR